MKLLHIIATPRADESNTLRIANAFLESLHAADANLSIDVIDLFKSDLPAVAGENIKTKYTLMVGQPIDKRHKESWQHIEAMIERFLSADIYLISAPMWNFSIPYALKYYIDCIIQPGYLFNFNEQGQAIGLVQGKKMVCVTTRGADYSEHSPFHAYDFQEAYLRAIFGYVGITDLDFINAQPMDATLALREIAVTAAIEQACNLAANGKWNGATPVAVKANPSQLKPLPLQA